MRSEPRSSNLRLAHHRPPRRHKTRGRHAGARSGHDTRSHVIHRNAARGIVRAGFICGVAFIVSSAIQGCVHGDDWRADLLWTTVFGGCAVLLLALVGSLGIRVLLRSRLPGEIARGNEAAGVAAAAHYAATGPVVGRLCARAALGARALPGAPAPGADAAAETAVRASRRRPRSAGCAGTQRRSKRGGGGLVSRSRISPHRDRMTDYSAFAERLTAGGVISDPWFEGEPRFRQMPIVLRASEQAALYRAAEDMATAWNELCLLCSHDPSLVSTFLGLTPVQQALW